MPVPRFTLSSDQLELLLAFEESSGLVSLSEAVGRDPSVVSRGLQRIAEDMPVLAKVKGRWQLTPLGRQTNELTKEYLQKQHALFAKSKKTRTDNSLRFSPNSVLLVINAQQGLLDDTQLGRNNSDAEKNIAALLARWRTLKRPIVHIRHVSESPESVFYRYNSGSEFLPDASPLKGETVIEKSKSSAFSAAELETYLRTRDVHRILLTGFTANECIDATARDASALGFETLVVGDATAMFDLRSPDGKLLKAERLHKLTLATIAAYYARIINTKDALI